MSARIYRFPAERVTPSAGRGPARVIWLQSAKELYERAFACDDEDPELGERLYRAALVQEPTMALAWTNLGNLEFRKGDRKAARVCYTKALMLDSTQPEGNYNLGYLFSVEGRHKAALPYFEEALKHDDAFADAWFNYGLSLMAIGRRVKARKAFQRYISLESEGAWAERAKRHLVELAPSGKRLASITG